MEVIVGFVIAFSIGLFVLFLSEMHRRRHERIQDKREKAHEIKMKKMEQKHELSREINNLDDEDDTVHLSADEIEDMPDTMVPQEHTNFKGTSERVLDELKNR